jgi:GNAT superfamily N-acetyltransferase
MYSQEERAAITDASAVPPFHAQLMREHGADAHVCAVSKTGEALAYCSLWWTATPPLANHRVGAIGHYAGANPESAALVLQDALRRLRQHHCTLAVGPMDGNTWRSYRFVTQSCLDEPPFFLEPANPPQWPQHFEHAGFTPRAQYYSALNRDLSRPDPRTPSVLARLEQAGVTIRSAAGLDLRSELNRIYQVSRVAFVNNFLYTELPLHSFLAQYTPLLQRIEPELVLLAERRGQLVGYLFALPDFAQAARGAAVDTFLIKTVAILPDPSLRGLGAVLVAVAHQAGLRLGYSRCIHALMHESNVSRRISGRYAETMRRYTLFAQDLA